MAWKCIFWIGLFGGQMTDLHARLGDGLLWPVGFDNTNRLFIDKKYILCRANIGLILPDDYTITCLKVYFRFLLDKPTAPQKGGVDAAHA